MIGAQLTFKEPQKNTQYDADQNGTGDGDIEAEIFPFDDDIAG